MTTNTPKKRVVRRLRCGECGHLKSEHVKWALCGKFYTEEVLLPVCVECGKRVCENEEDELCQQCFRKDLP